MDKTITEARILETTDFTPLYSKIHLVILSIIVFNVFTALHSAAQHGINFALGYSTVEHLNAGLRYEINQVKLGFTYGRGYERIYYGADVFFHLTGYSRHTSMYPIYLRSGLAYRLDEDGNRYMLAPLRVGIDIYFTSHIGLSPEIGFSIPVNTDDYLLRPAVSGSFFFRMP